MILRRRWAVLVGLVLASFGLAAAAIALTGTPVSDDEGGGSTRVEAAIADWRWAPNGDLPVERSDEEKPPSDEFAGAPAPAEAPAAEDDADAPEAPPEPPEAPSAPKLPDPDDEISRAEVLKNGIALPPLEAPPAVRAILEAGNSIARHPYKWGGGHGKWQDNGYDCSGSVSYALHAGGLLDGPLASGPLMQWGKPGKGKWVTIYTNPGHVFMVVAGVRFDTSAAKSAARSRWTNDMRPTGGYVARHPPGL